MNMKSIVSLVGGLSLIIGTAFAVDSHYAKAEDHVRLASSFKTYVAESRADTLQERIWEMEDRLRYTTDKKEQVQLKQRLRELRAELEKVDRQIKAEEKK